MACEECVCVSGWVGVYVDEIKEAWRGGLIPKWFILDSPKKSNKKETHKTKTEADYEELPANAKWSVPQALNNICTPWL